MSDQLDRCPACGARFAEGPEPATCGECGAAMPVVLFDRYRVLAILGEGGMGTVWRAHDLRLDRPVALKRIRADRAGTPVALERIVREARTAARLRHSNLVAVHDAGAEAGDVYIAMEYVAGRTFQAFLLEYEAARRSDRDGATRALREAVRLLAGAAAGVAAAHAEGIVHRDLKPANILIDTDGSPRVADFGLAREVDGAGGPDGASGPLLTRAGEVVGTPAYMSPEQALGERARIGPGSDVWALGAMLYEVLAGRKPFPGNTPFEVLCAVIAVKPTPPCELDSRVPPELEAVALRAMARNPLRRFAHAGEFAEELHRWLAGEPLRTRPPGAMWRGLRWLSRRRWGTALVGAVVLALGLGAWVVYSRLSSWRVLSLFQEVGEHFARYEDSVNRTEMSAEDRLVLGQQPRQLLEALLARAPRFGPGYSCRGRLHSLDRRYAEAEADLDRGCELAADEPYVWFLRALHYVERYGRARFDLAPLVDSSSADFAEARSETAAETGWRERAAADLNRALELPAGEMPLQPVDVRLCRALAALYSGGGDAAQQTLREVEGMAGPQVAMIRGLALFASKRFEEAGRAFAETAVEWRAYAPASAHRAKSRWIAAWRGDRRGEDPRAEYRAALDDLALAVRCDPHLPGAPDTRAGILIALAEAQLARGEDPAEALERALADCEEAVRLRPADASVTINRAMVRMRGGRAGALRGEDPSAAFRGAIADCDVALVLDPNSARARALRALSRVGLAVTDLERGADVRMEGRRALADVEEALRRDPQSVLAHHTRAETLLLLGRAEERAGADPQASYSGAVAACEAASTGRSMDPRIELGRGMSWLRLAAFRASHGADGREDARRAIADLTAALTHNPGLAPAFVERGNVHLLLGQIGALRGEDPRPEFRAAAEDATQARALNPRLAAAHEARGRAHLNLGKAAIQLGADGRASFREAVGDLAAAVACKPGGESYTTLGGARRWLAWLEERAGADPREEYRRALGEIDEGLRLDPGFGPAHNERGLACRSLAEAEAAHGGNPGDLWARAESDFRAAAERHEAAGRLNLGMLLRTLGRADEAIAEFEALARAWPAAAEVARAQIEETRKTQRR